MINKRDIVPELAEVFDGVSVSLNAHDRESYVRLCRPDAGGKAFDAVMDFIKRAAASPMECTVTVLDHPDVDIGACRTLIASIPRAKFRVRRYHLSFHEE
jgi:TatD DNase family protein